MLLFFIFDFVCVCGSVNAREIDIMSKYQTCDIEQKLMDQDIKQDIEKDTKSVEENTG